MKPHFSSPSVEAPQVVDSFSLLEDVAAREYNQVHQEQIVPTVQPHVTFQEIPEVQVVEQIQEQIVEPIEVLPQERVQLHTAIQIMDVPVLHIQEQSAGTVNSQFPITAVEASQVVDSYSLSEEFAAPAEVTTLNTSCTSTSSCAPVLDVAHATVPLDTSPACQATGRASCAYVYRALSFVLFLLIAEKNRLSFVYVLAMYTAIQTALFQYTLGRSTNSVMDSDDSLSYTVPIVDFTVTLQGT